MLPRQTMITIRVVYRPKYSSVVFYFETVENI
jgi:hypothetical protein